MIQSMRKNAAIIMWVVIVAFVATIVFAWGMDLSSHNRVKDSVGKVNGKDITLHYFEKLVNLEREKQREQYQGADVPAYQSRLVPRQVWEQEVSRILLKEIFAKMKIGASADEIFEFLKKNPPREVYSAKQFQTNNAFDSTKFIAFLNNPAIYDNEGIQNLEGRIRDFNVPIQSLQVLLSMSAFPSQSEIAYEYKVQHEKCVFEYACASSRKFAPDPVSDVKIEDYYKAHQDSFATDEQADLYFVKVRKAATASDDKATYDEMTALQKKINNNDSTFAEQARVESDDEGSNAQGGDLGWIKKGAMVPKFDSVAFSITPKVVSSPVRTQFGYHLIFVEDRQTKDGVVQAKVRHILRKVMPTGETIDRLSAMADSLHAKIVAEGVKAIVAKDTMVIVDSTGLFKRGDMIPKMGYVSGAGVFTFQHDAKEISDLLESDEGYFIVQVKQRYKKGVLPLSVVKQRIVAALSLESQKAKAKAYFDNLLQKITDKNAVALYSKTDSMIMSGQTDSVTKASYIPGVGMNNQAVAAAFALPVGKVSPVIEAAGNFYVVKPLWHKAVTDIPWNSPEIAELQKKIVKETAEKNYYDWYLDCKKKAKVIDNVNQFYID